jgi:SNF2 family DNA or RNA helicase
MSNKDKQKSVDAFQNNKNVNVFIGNIISAGVGITLTAANTVIFNSFDWVTGNNEQGEDRSYRIGQKDNVTVYYQLFEDTITTRMWYTLKYKKNIIDRILGVKVADDEIITEYIEYE